LCTRASLCRRCDPSSATLLTPHRGRPGSRCSAGGSGCGKVHHAVRGGKCTQGEHMMRTRKGATGLALGAVVALAAAACSSSGGGGGSATSAAAAPQKGGTLYILNLGPHNGLDPQASYVGADLEFAARAYARSLTTYSIGADSKLVPDLATDTGQASDGGKTWKFTLI